LESKYDGIIVPNVTLTVIDDDVAGITLSMVSVSISEDGDYAVYHVKLDS
jgi:hypothetical protein